MLSLRDVRSRAAAVLTTVASFGLAAVPAIAQDSRPSAGAETATRPGATSRAAAPTSRAVQGSPLTHELAIRLMEVDAAVQSADQILAQTMEQLEQFADQLPEGYADALIAKFDANRLNALLADVWAEELGAEAAKAAIAFYESDAGKRWKEALAAAERAAGDATDIVRKIQEGTPIAPVSQPTSHAESKPTGGEQQLALERVIANLRLEERAAIRMRLGLENLRRTPGASEEFVDQFAKVMTGERLMARARPVLLEKTDTELLREVNEWAASDEGRAYARALLVVIPKTQEAIRHYTRNM